MMQQAQQMMSNPAMQGQMAEQMKNMSADDLKNQMNQAEKQLPAAMAAAAPAVPVSVVAKLKASTMAVDDSIVEAVEEAENAKTLGNKKFKEGRGLRRRPSIRKARRRWTRCCPRARSRAPTRRLCTSSRRRATSTSPTAG